MRFVQAENGDCLHIQCRLNFSARFFNIPSRLEGNKKLTATWISGKGQNKT